MSSTQIMQIILRSARVVIPLLVVVALWSHIAPILLLLVIALLLTSILGPVADWLEMRLGGSRLAAVLSIYGAIILMVVLLVSTLGPILYEEAISMGQAVAGEGDGDIAGELKKSLLEMVPESYHETVESKLTDWVAGSGQFLQSLLRDLAGMIGALIGVIMNIVLVLVFTFILLMESRNFKVAFVRSVPNAYFEMTLNLLDKVHAQVSGYLRGQGIAAASVGVMSTIGLYLLSWIMDVSIPYAFIIGMLAGIANLIPFIGPFVGMVPAIISYIVTPQAAGIAAVVPIAIVAMFMFVQMIDNFLISPKIMSSSVGMHPLLVMVVIMVGNSIAGPLGMLFAVPTFGVFRAIIEEIVWGLKAYRML